MNIPMKQKQTHRHGEHRLVVAKFGGMEWIGSQSLADVNHYLYRVDKQQGPTMQHRELYPISCDKP